MTTPEEMRRALVLAATTLRAADAARWEREVLAAADLIEANLIPLSYAGEMCGALESVRAWWEVHQYDTDGYGGEYNRYGAEADQAFAPMDAIAGRLKAAGVKWR